MFQHSCIHLGFELFTLSEETWKLSICIQPKSFIPFDSFFSCVTLLFIFIFLFALFKALKFFNFLRDYNMIQLNIIIII